MSNTTSNAAVANREHAVFFSLTGVDMTFTVCYRDPRFVHDKLKRLEVQYDC